VRVRERRRPARGRGRARAAPMRGEPATTRTAGGRGRSKPVSPADRSMWQAHVSGKWPVTEQVLRRRAWSPAPRAFCHPVHEMLCSAPCLCALPQVPPCLHLQRLLHPRRADQQRQCKGVRRGLRRGPPSPSRRGRGRAGAAGHALGRGPPCLTLPLTLPGARRCGWPRSASTRCWRSCSWRSHSAPGSARGPRRPLRLRRPPAAASRRRPVPAAQRSPLTCACVHARLCFHACLVHFAQACRQPTLRQAARSTVWPLPPACPVSGARRASLRHGRARQSLAGQRALAWRAAP